VDAVSAAHSSLCGCSSTFGVFGFVFTSFPPHLHLFQPLLNHRCVVVSLFTVCTVARFEILRRLRLEIYYTLVRFLINQSNRPLQTRHASPLQQILYILFASINPNWIHIYQSILQQPIQPQTWASWTPSAQSSSSTD